MKVAVLGTGQVGQTLAAKLVDLGHEVSVGTRDVDDTLSRTEPGRNGTPPFASWQAEHSSVSLLAFADLPTDVDLVVNATSGSGALDALGALGEGALDGTVVIDVANGLDLSQGFPPTLLVANTDSLGEQIQRTFPSARVVKTLNTVAAAVMVDPGSLAEPTQVFLSGDDAAAKDAVRELLGSFGWAANDIVDVGGIKTARGVEMYVTLWIDLMMSLGTSDFNIKIIKK